MKRPGKCKRPFILPTDHLRGAQALRTDYSEFETPTFMRRWLQAMRERRAARGMRLNTLEK